MQISLGFSPCPNDTFIFDALVHQRIDTEGLSFDVRLGDVEELNRLAFAGALDVTKLSYHAFGYLTEQYALLNAGSALGRGVGPLLVTADEALAEKLVAQGDGPEFRTSSGSSLQIAGDGAQVQRMWASGKVAIPGKYTTANYLLGLAFPAIEHKEAILFSDIEREVLAGNFTAGLLIHENRFTYRDRGLHKIADLGEFWESTTGLPIPLGGIVVNKKLDPAVQKTVDRVLARSVAYAFEHPEASAAYVAAHAQEMDPEVRRKHINLYVNDFSRDLGPEGRRAVTAFLQQGRERGVIPAGPEDIFVA
ncbi:1,4-dihydroxy-6-naphthoate synthase [Lewinella sp. W8]|uniref:1,4-dihydroxy-6-naphthoate synthase n=1 Tax=Lewinella sp. W8 TaxID=2528208 RepID=UPI001068CB61|nr:1,4-dihydroxy-6-naphthoate synthase [Lewinella sp. W8]MTB50796.1 1,4-dihydroxy-6-naphthoate synthase [Lewinella sp. W8]